MTYDGLTKVSKIIVPADVDHIDLIDLKVFWELAEISVDPSNKCYVSKDGILYSKDLSKILFVPPKDMIKNFSIPGTVIEIAGDEFNDNVHLEVLNIPATCNIRCFDVNDGYIEDIERFNTLGESCEFPLCAPNLKKINVDPDHPCLYSFNGVLFSKSKCTLLKWPPGLRQESCTIPAMIRFLGDYAFARTDIKRIVIEDIDDMGESCFSESKLESISIGIFRELKDDNASEDPLKNRAFMTGSLSYIPTCAFKGCESLKEVVLGGIEYISWGAFIECVNLECI